MLQAMQGPSAPDLIPQEAQQVQQLEDMNRWVYDDIANGAYKAGFASTQLAYKAGFASTQLAYKRFFQGLDRAELLLSQPRLVLACVISH